ncbi:hypothetical protein CVD28_05060 [Bacillus sp. M6-12]|nr:hypothetical protein CVD28_05060 [Bacillus sp. M6-12]
MNDKVYYFNAWTIKRPCVFIMETGGAALFFFHKKKNILIKRKIFQCKFATAPLLCQQMHGREGALLIVSFSKGNSLQKRP